MSEAQQAVVVAPRAGADASVIWLHGLGADGHDFEPVVAAMPASLTRHVRFVFPHAPMRPVTINGGMVMRAWYDVLEPDITRRPDAAGIRDSAGILEEYIAAEAAAGRAAGRILLAGFSQGGAVALHAGLRHAQRLAGIAALSTYLPLPERLAREAAPANRGTPLFMAHGMQDPLIAPAHALRSRDLLRELGYEVQWHEYPMPHAVCAEEIEALSAWLEALLG